MNGQTAEKLVQFNISDEKLLNVAIDRRARGDLFGALSTLLSMENRGSKMAEMFAQIAMIYTDMELYGNSAHYWFKYLANTSKTKSARAYNALGANYYFAGNFIAAGYYFEKQVSETSEQQEYDDVMIDYYDELCDSPQPDFYVCYPETAKPSDVLIDEGDGLFDKNEFAAAYDKYATVREGDELYSEAQIKCAGCLYAEDKFDEAVAMLKNQVERFPDDKAALLNLLGMLYSLGRKEDAAGYLARAERMSFTDGEDCYKLATSYCDAGEHERAREMLIRALDDDPYNVNALFVLGLVLFNLKEIEGARECFYKCYIATGKSVSKYYLDLCYEVLRDPSAYAPLGYYFSVPESVGAKWVKEIEALFKGGKRAIQRADKTQLIELAKWIMPTSPRVSVSLAETLLDTPSVQIRNFYIELLLDPRADDGLKTVIIEKLVERGYNKKVAVTFGFTFNRIQLYRAEFEFEKRKVFNEAYAYAFGKLAPFEGDKTYKIRDGAYKLYDKLFDNGNLRFISDKRALAAAIAVYAELKISNDAKTLAEYFGTERKKLRAIIELAEEKE